MASTEGRDTSATASTTWPTSDETSGGATSEDPTLSTESLESSTSSTDPSTEGTESGIVLDDTGTPPPCMAPGGHTVCDGDGDLFHAIGLNCDSEGDDHTPILDPRVSAADPDSWRITRVYGNEEFSAQEGLRLLVLTTGTLPLADDTDRIDLPFGHTRLPGDEANNDNPDDQTLPLPIRSLSGSLSEPFVDCDGHGDCSETLPQTFDRANDLVYFTFDVEVPDGTFGYAVDIAWFSSEFPIRTGMPDNDLFVWWQSSDAFTGNIATFEGSPMTATGLQPYIGDPETDAATGNVAKLQDTGYEGTVSGQCSFPWGTYNDCPNGGTTGWMTLHAPVQPGEIVSIAVALFDQGDTRLDTAVVLDNWRWSCAGCNPATTCGVHPR